MATKKKKSYAKFRVRIGDATALQQRIAAGEATPGEQQHYEKIIREFRRKLANGTLSPQSARQFGIE
jgi:hypothetical protein